MSDSETADRWDAAIERLQASMAGKTDGLDSWEVFWQKLQDKYADTVAAHERAVAAARQSAGEEGGK